MINSKNTYLKYDIEGYVFFFIFFPLTSYFFYRELQNVFYTILIIALPILVCYIIPYIGINILKLWKFKSKFRIGNMPLLHGFSFGSSINLFGLIMYKLSPVYKGWSDTLFFAFVLASLITFWNLIIDVQAVKDGYIEIYNREFFEKKHSYDIVCDYAISYFFSFGFIYSLFIKLVEYFSACGFNLILAVIFYILTFTVPTIIYSIVKYIKNGNFGIFPYKEE